MDPVTKSLLKYGKEKAIEFVWSFSDQEKMRKAVEESRQQIQELLEMMAAGFDAYLAEKFGEGLPQLPPERQRMVARVLVDAHINMFGEVDEERLRMLAAAVVGLAAHPEQQINRSAVWRIIKQIDPAAVYVLYLEDHLYARKLPSIGPIPEQILRNADRYPYLEKLVALGCGTFKREIDYDPTSKLFGQPSLTDAVRGTPDEVRGLKLKERFRVTRLGRDVMEILIPFILERAGQETTPETEESNS